MSKTKTHGRFMWHDLISPDPKAALAFYGELFGWKSRTIDMGRDTYTILSVGDKDVGGVMSEQASKGIPPHWQSYFTTRDIDASVKQVEALGGKVVVKPTGIPDGGRFAVLADPQGAHFGLLAPGEEKYDANALPRTSEFCWVELHTDDPKAAVAFYGKLLGWTVKHEAASPGGAPYNVMARDDGQMAAGIMKKPMPGPNGWLAYVSVDDVDHSAKRTTALRGKVHVPPTDIPDVGRFAVVADPTGGVIAMLKPIPPTKK